MRGGDLWESWGVKTNWVRLPRVHNMWRVWLAEWMGTPPQKITCVNNLKQIGLAIRIWSGDNNDQYPFHLSTNLGGTLEHCAAGPDGFDRNGWLHLCVLSNELNTPLVLVCPQDRTKKAATNFNVLRAENVTYRVRSGPEVSETNAQAVLAICPVDGNTLYCDGTVVEGKTLRGKR